MFTHSNNSQFQYVYFLVGKCHTADEAYRIIKDQLEDRTLAIRVYEAGEKKRRAKRIRIDEQINPLEHPATRLEAEAELEELQAHEGQAKACYDEALREKAFLEDLLERLQPYRKYSHLQDHEAMQACQREEWLYELLQRVENYVQAQGSVPPDQFAAMRLHPDFDNVIMPHILAAVEHRRSGKLLISRPPMANAMPHLLATSTEPKKLKE